MKYTIPRLFVSTPTRDSPYSLIVVVIFLVTGVNMNVHRLFYPSIIANDESLSIFPHIGAAAQIPTSL